MNKLYFIITVCTIFFYSCDENKKQSISITKEINFTKEGELFLKKPTTDSVFKTLDIEFAETEYETQTGLMYRHNDGRVIKPCYLFLRKNSRAPSI